MMIMRVKIPLFLKKPLAKNNQLGYSDFREREKERL